MVRRFSRRLVLSGSVAVVIALVLAVPAAAGGWATATLDDTSGGAGPTAGEPTEVGFTLKQHGVTPIDWESATFVGRNPETGESVRAEARPSGGRGHYVATVTFPSDGEWRWHLELRDLLYGLPDGSHGTNAAQPLSVAAAAVPPSTPQATGSPAADPLLIAAVGLLMFLAGAFVGSFRGGARRVPAEADPEPAAAGQLATR